MLVVSSLEDHYSFLIEVKRVCLVTMRHYILSRGKGVKWAAVLVWYSLGRSEVSDFFTDCLGISVVRTVALTQRGRDWAGGDTMRLELLYLFAGGGITLPVLYLPLAGKRARQGTFLVVYIRVRVSCCDDSLCGGLLRRSSFYEERRVGFFAFFFGRVVSLE